MSNKASILFSPYLKGKGFNPMPISRGGIPKEANSVLNPRVIGTPAYNSFWNDQIYLIHNGFQTGNIFIPGRYYYYLNFNNMSTAAGIITPDMIDLHLELTYLYEFARANGKDLIIAKKRRAGISEFAHKAIVDYEARFTNGSYKCGVAAGQDTFVQEFIEKLRSSEALLPPELQLKKLKDNDDEITYGYKIKGEDGNMNMGGTRNKLYIRTMFKNPALFKGLALQTIIGEECGEFEKLSKFIQHSMACTKIGSLRYGTIVLFGTGGAMNKGSKDFHEEWEKAKKGHGTFIPFSILGPRFHAPFYGGCSYQKPETPYLLEKHKPHEIIGCEDLKKSKESILEERQNLLKAGDREEYEENLKDFPLEEKDIFRKTIINVFDTEKMQDQADAISTNNKKYVVGNLEWKKDSKGEVLFPLQVEYKLLHDIEEDGDCILFHIDHLTPIRTHSNLYCAGGDSYDQHKAKTSKSQGAMCVMIRRNTILGQESMMPVATICCRPKHKEIFYEMCLKLAIFYFCDDKGHITTPNSFLIDVANKLIFKYFEERGYASLLAYRPRKFESEHSEQTHTYGVHLNNHSKPLMVGLMQSAVDYYCKNIWFPELISQLQNYDHVEIGSDNDLADAYGIALMQDASDDNQSRDLKDWDNPEMFNLTEWKTDANGNKVPVVTKLDPHLLIKKDDFSNPSRFVSLD